MLFINRVGHIVTDTDGVNVTRADYYFTIVTHPTMSEQVMELRRPLLNADPRLRQAAFTAVQDAARAALNIPTASEYEVLNIWKSTLEKILLAPLSELGNSLYAILVVQACAIIAAEPILLLTPDVVKNLEPLQNEIQQCSFGESAQAVFRAFWTATKDAAYGMEERDFARVWEALPAFGVAASLLDSTSPNFDLMSRLQTVRKEMLCSNAATELGWRRPPPKYLSLIHI